MDMSDGDHAVQRMDTNDRLFVMIYHPHLPAREEKTGFIEVDRSLLCNT